ncbi:GTPase [Acrocarpospora pleiomorpha]|uniref:GTPase n=1 Tax=Acrocarpospora pleiomorpha TaxID=90975 RepID=UPI001FE69D67|nr:GTPase [Acrocarpospora pleiomorpha]
MNDEVDEGPGEQTASFRAIRPDDPPPGSIPEPVINQAVRAKVLAAQEGGSGKKTESAWAHLSVSATPAEEPTPEPAAPDPENAEQTTQTTPEPDNTEEPWSFFRNPAKAGSAPRSHTDEATPAAGTVDSSDDTAGSGEGRADSPTDAIGTSGDTQNSDDAQDSADPRDSGNTKGLTDAQEAADLKRPRGAKALAEARDSGDAGSSGDAQEPADFKPSRGAKALADVKASGGAGGSGDVQGSADAERSRGAKGLIDAKDPGDIWSFGGVKRSADAQSSGTARTSGDIKDSGDDEGSPGGVQDSPDAGSDGDVDSSGHLVASSEGSAGEGAGGGYGSDAGDVARVKSGTFVRAVQEEKLPETVSAALTAALAQLREAVTGLHFGLDVPGADEARKSQAAVLTQLDDYVIPRVHMSTAPALVVVAGSTGAGKSTLVNTLAAQQVSATGVRRPTTGTPVLACHPDDRDWFVKGDLLPGLRRLDKPGEGAGLDSIVIAPTERLPQGVALLDTPDIDSVVEEHHQIAHRMLDAADLWVFVTTAARYADAPSWGLLRLAKERNARLVIILTRVPPKSRDVIVKHFVRMLDEYGLGEVERFVVNETTVTNSRLPDDEVTELRMWLAELSVDDQRRTHAVQMTLNGVLNSFRNRVPALARHLETQVALRADLRSDVDSAYMSALAEIDEATRNGSLLRGEVLARWQDFAGSGDLMRTLQLRRASKAGQQGPERLRALKGALHTGLESVITSAAQRAAEEVVTRWRQRAGAGDKLAAIPGLGRPTEEAARRTSRMVTSWQDHVTELIRTEGVTKRSVAKLVSFDVQSLALIFTVGLLGYGTTDVSVGSGNSALPQRLLRGLLGAESLRSISAKARSDLRARIGLLFDDETLRYVDALDSAGIPDEAAATRLYQATYNLEVAR